MLVYGVGILGFRAELEVFLVVVDRGSRIGLALLEQACQFKMGCSGPRVHL